MISKSTNELLQEIHDTRRILRDNALIVPPVPRQEVARMYKAWCEYMRCEPIGPLQFPGGKRV